MNESFSSRILERRDKLLKVVSVAHDLNLTDEDQRMQAEALLESEAYYFETLLEKTRNTKNDLTDTTDLSQRGLFLEVISKGLTFSPSMNFIALAYRNQEISFIEDKVRRTKTEKRLSYFHTANGKQFLCIRAGSILRVRPPQIVFENDVFTHKQVNGVDQVVYEDNSQGQGRIIAGFVWVVLPDGREDFFKMYRADMDRLAGFSARNSGGKANDLYSNGQGGDYDTGFFKNKIISHALAPYNKTRMVSAFEADGDPDTIQTDAPPFIADKPMASSLPETVITKTDGAPIVIHASGEPLVPPVGLW